MYRKRETKIADAIRTDSSNNRIFAYVVLFVISLVVVVVGYVLAGLVTALSKHMETVVVNINSMSASMRSMQKDMTRMTKHIQSMDTSTNVMSVDMNKMRTSVESMSHSLTNMEGSTQDMKDDISEMNKLNPMRHF